MGPVEAGALVAPEEGEEGPGEEKGQGHGAAPAQGQRGWGGL